MGVRKRMELQAGIRPKHHATTATAKSEYNFPFQALQPMQIYLVQLDPESWQDWSPHLAAGKWPKVGLASQMQKTPARQHILCAASLSLTDTATAVQVTSIATFAMTAV